MHIASYISEKARVAPPQCDVALVTLRISHDAMRVSSGLASAKPASSKLASLRTMFAALCAVAAFLTGCGANQKPRARAFPWATAKNVRPLAPQTKSSDVSNEDLFAELGLVVPAPPSPVAGLSSTPSRPRVAVVAPTGGGASRVPEAPMIAPQLSPEQTAEAQQQTSASVNIAEKNIAASQGRSLNAMQSDLASKVRSFLAEAREAARVSDWTRASSAAKKAEVLSQELAGSF
jgi:hypothetical protein